MFRRGRFSDVVERQLSMFESDHRDAIDDAQEKLDAYNAADRDEAEELYGDYVDAVETGTELLADIRDAFARTLGDDAAERYEHEFNRAVAKRFPRFALEIENR